MAAPGGPGVPDTPTYVLIRYFCSDIWGIKGWGRDKGGERELAKGWKAGHMGDMSISGHLSISVQNLSLTLFFHFSLCVPLLFALHFLPSTPSTASRPYSCISGSSHPLGCPGCRTQTAFGDCQGRSTHRCGSSAQSRFCGHHTTPDGHEGKAECPGRTNPLACCRDLPPAPHPQSSSGSLVMAHAHSQHWLGEGELQHQLVLGVLALPGIVPDQHCWAGGCIVGGQDLR